VVICGRASRDNPAGKERIGFESSVKEKSGGRGKQGHRKPTREISIIPFKTGITPPQQGRGGGGEMKR